MPLNHNVKLAFWWTFFENFSSSVRSGDALSACIFLVTGHTKDVGFIQGLNGVCQLVVAVPAGIMCDVLRRDQMLRIGSVVGLASTAALAATMASPTINLAWLTVAMGIMGCYRGLYTVALESVFADSVEPGRSSLYTRKHIITVLASGFGPCISVVLFSVLGNTWDVATCRAVILAGLTPMIAALVLMLFFDDDKAFDRPRNSLDVHDRHHDRGLKSAREASSSPSTDETEAPLVTEARSATDVGFEEHVRVLESQDLSRPLLDVEEHGFQDASDSTASPTPLPAPPEFPGAGCPRPLETAVLISVSDLLSAFASGMTVKFFAIFFLHQVGLGPAAVAALGAACPAGIAAAAKAAQTLAKRSGRIEVTLVARLADIALLLTLAALPVHLTGALVTVHILRTAVANSPRALTRSQLMDVIPRHLRGKVNALESATQFSWSGSAALGGLLVERVGFRGTFFITAGIKFLSWLTLLALWVLRRTAR